MKLSILEIYFLYIFISILFSFICFKFWIKYYFFKEKSKDFLKSYEKKKNTPTCGGIIMYFCLLPFFLLTKNYLLMGISFLGLCLGYIDDFLKPKGLNNYLRIFLWSITGIIIAFISFQKSGSNLLIPLLNQYIDLKYFYIIFSGIFVFLGGINGINMTDGLDGIVTFPLLLNCIFLSIVAICFYYVKLLLLLGGLIGILISYLWFNSYKAKIFMGDSGSIFLGFLISSIFIFYRLELFFFITGNIFAVNVICSFLQVLYIKYFKKKLFLMAPLHHHFEEKGKEEPEIIFKFWWWSLLNLLIALFFFFNFYKILGN